MGIIPLHCKGINTIYKHLLQYLGATLKKSFFHLWLTQYPNPQQTTFLSRGVKRIFKELRSSFLIHLFFDGWIDFHYTVIHSTQLLFSKLDYCNSNLNRISKCHPCLLSERGKETVNEKQSPGAKNF